jgi:hypothetical protein
MLDFGRTIVVRQHGCQVECVCSGIPPPPHPATTSITESKGGKRWPNSDREEQQVEWDCSDRITVPVRTSYHNQSESTHKDEVRKGKRFSDARGADERPQQVAPNRKIATMVYIIAEMPSYGSAPRQLCRGKLTLRICDMVGRSRISLTGLYDRSVGSRMKNKTPFLHICAVSQTLAMIGGHTFRNVCNTPANMNMNLGNQSLAR